MKKYGCKYLMKKPMKEYDKVSDAYLSNKKIFYSESFGSCFNSLLVFYQKLLSQIVGEIHNILIKYKIQTHYLIFHIKYNFKKTIQDFF